MERYLRKLLETIRTAHNYMSFVKGQTPSEPQIGNINDKLFLYLKHLHTAYKFTSGAVQQLSSLDQGLSLYGEERQLLKDLNQTEVKISAYLSRLNPRYDTNDVYKVPFLEIEAKLVKVSRKTIRNEKHGKKVPFGH